MSDQREVRALTFGEVCDELCVNRPTLVLFHAHPDGDATGSAFSLRAILRAMGIPAWCVCADMIHRRYRFAFDGVQDSVFPEDIPTEFGDCRVITVDTASRGQMGRLAEMFEGRVDMMIDHHGRGEHYADYYVDANAAACGEIIFDIADELIRRGKLAKLPDRVPLWLYMAIVTDTGGFKYSNTTPETHRRASNLLDGSFDHADLNFRLFDAKEPEELKVTKGVLEKMRFLCDGEISYVAMSAAEFEALGVSTEYSDVLINVARSVAGVKVAVAVREIEGEPGRYKASLRSSCDFDVATICAYFGGGGHVRAAGCALSADSAEAAAETVAAEVERRLG